jgi:hypothetical protein
MAISKKSLSKQVAGIMKAEEVSGTTVKSINASTLVSLARNYSRAAIKTMSELMEDSSMPPAVRVRAAEILLERGYGKAAQAVVIGNADGSPVVGAQALSIAERIAALKRAKETKDDTIDLEANDAVTEVTEPEPVQEVVQESSRDNTDIL